ncbi:MAG: sugar ABC transporter permease [Actinobacteria bacterium]|nr:sugar ABC transporter permease [Actinomycetota bacterium]
MFFVIPMISAGVISFTEWDLLTPPRWVGLANFQELIHDQDFLLSLRNTLLFILGYLPLVLILGLSAALALDRKFRGSNALRAAYFLPVITSWVIVALLWKWILNPNGGLVNSLLAQIGIQGPGWWTSKSWSMASVIIPSAWKDMGYVMLLLLAGLQSIPPEYKEAAAIDGASKRQILLKITLPLLTPALFFVLVISLINNFQVFDQIWVMTQGGPEGSTSVVVQQIVKNSFDYGHMGYASAMSMVLFVIIMLITGIQLRLQKRWVNYE